MVPICSNEQERDEENVITANLDSLKKDESGEKNNERNVISVNLDDSQEDESGETNINVDCSFQKDADGDTQNSSNVQDTISENDSQSILNAQHDESTLRRSSRGLIPKVFKDYFTSYNADISDNIDGEHPDTYADILKRQDKNEWLKAIDDEVKSMEYNNVWSIVERPTNVKPLKSKWVFRIKRDENERVSRYKARLVAKGFLQKYGIDYEETFAPVAKLTTIRIFLAVGVQCGYHFHQMDVKTAFLHGDLKEQIFMEAPEGISLNDNEVFQLNKSLYGLKQSPRCWNEKINMFLLKIGFVRSNHDYCLYVKNHNSSVVYLLLYVDDLLIASPNRNEIEFLKNELSKNFSMSDSGDLTYFLGIKVDYSKKDGVMKLSQETNFTRILEKFEMIDCKPAVTPFEKLVQIPKS